jgi:large subunit ribosomal protein L10
MANRIKNAVIAEYQRRLGATPDFVAVDFNGLSVLQVTELRKLAKEKGIAVLVVKTSLALVALKDAAQADALKGVVAGPTALVYGGDGLPAIAKLVGSSTATGRCWARQDSRISTLFASRHRAI